MREAGLFTAGRVARAIIFGLLAGGCGGGLIARDLLGLSTSWQALLWTTFAAMGAVAGFADTSARSLTLTQHRLVLTAMVTGVLAVACFVLLSSPWNVVVVVGLALAACVSGVSVTKQGRLPPS